MPILYQVLEMREIGYSVLNSLSELVLLARFIFLMQTLLIFLWGLLSTNLSKVGLRALYYALLLIVEKAY